jgi:hypothetical protein
MNGIRNRDRRFAFAAIGADDGYELQSASLAFLPPLFSVFLGRSDG